MSSNLQNAVPGPVPVIQGNWQDLFIDHYERTLNVAASAKVAGVSRPTVYKYYDRDPEFKARFDNAKASAIDTLEGSAYQRATFGVPVVQERFDVKTGNVVSRSETRNYSDTLAVKLLECNRPETYRSKQQMEFSGTVAVTMTVEEQYREVVTPMVQRLLDAGFALERALQELLSNGVPESRLALIRSEDLKFPVVENTEWQPTGEFQSAIDITAQEIKSEPQHTNGNTKPLRQTAFDFGPVQNGNGNGNGNERS